MDYKQALIKIMKVCNAFAKANPEMNVLFATAYVCSYSKDNEHFNKLY